MSNKKSALNRKVSDRLKRIRREWDITQETAARQCGISPAAISHFELGRRTPSAENLVKLANGYHTTTDYILGRVKSNLPYGWESQ